MPLILINYDSPSTCWETLVKVWHFYTYARFYYIIEYLSWSIFFLWFQLFFHTIPFIVMLRCRTSWSTVLVFSVWYYLINTFQSNIFDLHVSIAISWDKFNYLVLVNSKWQTKHTVFHIFFPLVGKFKNKMCIHIFYNTTKCNNEIWVSIGVYST
jgi:hypothetical protein